MISKSTPKQSYSPYHKKPSELRTKSHKTNSLSTVFLVKSPLSSRSTKRSVKMWYKEHSKDSTAQFLHMVRHLQEKRTLASVQITETRLKRAFYQEWYPTCSVKSANSLHTLSSGSRFPWSRSTFRKLRICLMYQRLTWRFDKTSQRESICRISLKSMWLQQVRRSSFFRKVFWTELSRKPIWMMFRLAHTWLS